MTTTELRTTAHKLIDNIEDNAMLEALVSFLKSAQSQDSESPWLGINEDEKKEVNLSFEESQNEENLVSKKDFLDSL